jgi:hypothetical protein
MFDTRVLYREIHVACEFELSSNPIIIGIAESQVGTAIPRGTAEPSRSPILAPAV